MPSDKVFYWLIFFTLLFWIIFSCIPAGVCVNTYVNPIIHWSVCSNMGFVWNVLYVLFVSVLILISVYLMFVSTLKIYFNPYLGGKKKK